MLDIISCKKIYKLLINTNNSSFMTRGVVKIIEFSPPLTLRPPSYYPPSPPCKKLIDKSDLSEDVDAI